jgi:hypothetical protein
MTLFGKKVAFADIIKFWIHPIFKAKYFLREKKVQMEKRPPEDRDWIL